MKNLPESNFIWRRIYSFISSSVLLGLIGYVVFKMDTDTDLKAVAFWLCFLLWWAMLFYMIAPTAEQITRIIQAGKSLRFGATAEDIKDAIPSPAPSKPSPVTRDETFGGEIEPEEIP